MADAKAKLSLKMRFVPLIILGAVALVVVAGVLGYFVWKKSTQPVAHQGASGQSTSEEVLSVGPAMPADSLVAATDTSDWKTFASPSFDLTFKYPPDLEVDPEPDSFEGPISLDDFGHAYSNGGIIPVSGTEIDIATTTLAKTSLDALVNNELEGDTNISTDSISLAGVSCERTFDTVHLYATLSYAEESVYCPFGDSLYEFYLSYHGPQQVGFNDEFESMLSMLKIMQPTSTSNGIDWKTYTNEQYGFRFEYPPAWTFDKEGIYQGDESDGFNILGQPEASMGDDVNMYIQPAGGKTLSQFASLWEGNSPNGGMENLTVSGRQAELYKNVIGRNYTTDSLIIDTGNGFVIFDGDGATYQNDYEQILPTFQFFQPQANSSN